MKRVLLFALPLLLLASCSKDQTPDATTDGRIALSASASIDQIALSKASDDAWGENDQIGIWMMDAGTVTPHEAVANRLYTTAAGDGNFAPPAGTKTIYLPINGDVDFFAYYPHTDGVVDEMFTVDLTDQSDLTAIDILGAELLSTPAAPINKDHAEVNFTFEHKMTHLVFNMQQGIGAETFELAGMSATISGQLPSCTYDILLGTLGFEALSSVAIEMNASADGTLLQAILAPTDEVANPIVAGRKVLFTLADGRHFELMIPDDKHFAAGDKNIYAVTLNREGADITASIEDWNVQDGGEITGK